MCCKPAAQTGRNLRESASALIAATILVALIAVHAVVDVPTHIGMTEIRRIIVAMATGALEDRVVTRVGMAGCANTIRVAVVCREIRVIEGRSRPARGGVAGIARGREASRLVIGIGGPVVVSGMATIASGRQCRVVVVHVALRAGHVGCVITGQRESRVVVIKRCALPVREIVAGITGGREADGRMRWSVGAVVIGLMALDTGPAGQFIGAARAECRVMALRALHGRVEAGQRETGGCVIKGRTTPVGGRVALIACSRESRLYVVGIGCAIEISLMALNAGSRVRQVIGPARTKRGGMALRAL